MKYGDGGEQFVTHENAEGSDCVELTPGTRIMVFVLSAGSSTRREACDTATSRSQIHQPPGTERAGIMKHLGTLDNKSKSLQDH